MKWILLVVVAVGLVGCSGKVITYTSCADGVCMGVPFNTLKEVPSYYTYDRILGADGKAIRIAGDVSGKECTPVDVKEVALVVSQVQNYIYYDAGFLETSKFNVDLNANGTLSKVATESTPAAKDVAEAIATLATAYTTLKPVSTSNMINIPQCTSKAP